MSLPITIHTERHDIADLYFFIMPAISPTPSAIRYATNVSNILWAEVHLSFFVMFRIRI
jgi:hypothetical protein